MRKKLIELLKEAYNDYICDDTAQQREKFADYLLANVVVVLPCKVGDTVYYPSSSCDKIFEKTVDEILMNEECIYIHFASTYMPSENIGKTVFLTREEAERKLKKFQK